MTNRLRNILIGAVGVIIVLLGGLFSGALDGVLRQLNIQIAGHPAPLAAAAGSTDVVATPAPAQPGAEATAPAAETVVPVFDIVRVEPTGDAVIAGRSDPEAKVEILSGKDVVAGGKANDTGSWAIVLSDPLKPGAHDLSVRATSKAGKVETSEQSVAVSVPEGGNGDVLVVLNQPGSPSTVLQVPGLKETEARLADAGVAMPKADVPAAPAPVVAEPAAASAPAPAAPVAAEPKPAEPATASAGSAPAAAAVAIPAPPTDMLAAAATPDLKAAPAAAAPAEVAPAQPAPAAEPAPAAVEPAPAAPAVAEPAPVSAEPAPVSAEPAPAAAEPAPAAVAGPVVTIDAVELENGTRFFAAGSATSGATIRVYVDDKAVGDTRADKGRWLFQGSLELAPGKHLVRIDQVGADGKVLARAEVPFEIANDVLTAPTLASGVGSAQLGAGSAGEVASAEPATLIIRRGDNLWMIAKRLYGKGVRYSTIYQANTDQIRNPDLIYPGQVFVIPKGDAAWEPVGQ